MGARGPMPTPRATLEARGSRRAEGREDAAPFAPGKPNCPAELSDEARREWARIVPARDSAGVLCKTDRALLVAYCRAWGEWWELCKQVESVGYLIKTQQKPDGSRGNVVHNPLLS